MRLPPSSGDLGDMRIVDYSFNEIMHRPSLGLRSQTIIHTTCQYVQWRLYFSITDITLYLTVLFYTSLQQLLVLHCDYPHS